MSHWWFASGKTKPTLSGKVGCRWPASPMRVWRRCKNYLQSLLPCLHAATKSVWGSFQQSSADWLPKIREDTQFKSTVHRSWKVLLRLQTLSPSSNAESCKSQPKLSLQTISHNCWAMISSKGKSKNTFKIGELRLEDSCWTSNYNWQCRSSCSKVGSPCSLRRRTSSTSSKWLFILMRNAKSGYVMQNQWDAQHMVVHNAVLLMDQTMLLQLDNGCHIVLEQGRDLPWDVLADSG